MTGEDVSGGPLDVATLDVIARRAATHPLVADWTYRPAELSPRRLELRLDAGQYPAPVRAAKLDVRWFERGDYTFHYLETLDDDTWQCRWDRHAKPDGPRAHFHPPPEAGPDVEPSDVGPADSESAHHLDVLFAVLERIQERVATLYAE